MHFLVTSFILSLIITVIGFKRTVWFISIGYTFSIAGMCLLLAYQMDYVLHWGSWLQIGLLFIWAIRLGFFIIKRESNQNYRNRIEKEHQASQSLKFPTRFGIWISVCFLYVAMFSPAYFALLMFASPEPWQEGVFYLGLAILAAGVYIESLADRQKSKFKERTPGRFVDKGLYAWVRYPNYFGEILVWLGSFICAIPFMTVWWEWALALFGLVCIVLIMIGSSKRLELKQEESYGEDPEFKEYEKRVPILFPWLPIYSLKKVKFALG